MSLSESAFDALNEHWAIAAIGSDQLKRAKKLVNERLARRAVGNQISFAFEESAEDEHFLKRVAFALELAAIEGLERVEPSSRREP